MRFEVVKRLLSFFGKKRKDPEPLVTHHDDLRLVQKVHRRKVPGVKQIRHIGHFLTPAERKSVRLLGALFVLGVVWLGASIIRNYRVQVPDVGGRYVEAAIGSPYFVNPLFSSVNEVDADLVKLIYSGLMRYDQNGNLVPDLATEYSLSDDKKVYTFKLRSDVVWHDGQLFTSEDVVTTFELVSNPEVRSPQFPAFQGVKVEAVDEHTVKFTLPEPFAPFLDALTMGILPNHIWSEIPVEQLRLARYNLVDPVGTGPFKFKRLVKNETGYVYQYELVRFGKYYNHPPYIEEFTMRFYAGFEGTGSDTNPVQALREQKVDALSFIPSNQLDKVERKRIEIHTFQLPQYTALFLNPKHQSLLSDVNVRKALAYALDKDRILRESAGDDGTVIYGPVLPGYPGYNPDVAKTPYSAEEANKLLDKKWPRITIEEYKEKRIKELMKLETEAVSDTASTTTSTPKEDIQKQVEERVDKEVAGAQTFYRVDKDKNVIQLEIVTTDTPEYKHTAALVVGFWQELGIKTTINEVSSKNLSRDVLKNRSYDILLYGVIIGNDPDQYPFWHSSQIAFPGLNLSQYSNRTVDDLLEKARQTANMSDREAQYKKLQDILLSEFPTIFLYTPGYRYVTNDDIKGINEGRISHPSDRYADVMNWYLKTDGQWKFSR